MLERNDGPTPLSAEERREALLKKGEPTRSEFASDKALDEAIAGYWRAIRAASGFDQKVPLDQKYGTGRFEANRLSKEAEVARDGGHGGHSRDSLWNDFT